MWQMFWQKSKDANCWLQRTLRTTNWTSENKYFKDLSLKAKVFFVYCNYKEEVKYEFK